MMKEYKNRQSWTKLLSVPLIGYHGFHTCAFHTCANVLYISEDDQVFISFLKKEKYSLVINDSLNNTFKIP
jgi:serine acetyltransferase